MEDYTIKQYELANWSEARNDFVGVEPSDNNSGLEYGIYWLDENGEVLEVEWFKTEEERSIEINNWAKERN